MDKTNVMRVLDSKKVKYNSHEYEPDATMTGEEIAGILGEPAEKVFKTLVTQAKSGQFYVFVVPVIGELDLKKAAKAAGEKAISMIIGMKKRFPTFLHETARDFERIYVSAGKVGYQVELSPDDLVKIVGCKFADVVI